jgi:hypothetical protein
MDIYRYFHPHHNPRLYNTPLRQQELSELEQAAAELRKGLERAQKRCSRASSPPIMDCHFGDVIKAIRFVENSLQTLCDAHPGDGAQTLFDLVSERSEFSGWEAWTSLVREQLSSKIQASAGLEQHQAVSVDQPARRNRGDDFMRPKVLLDGASEVSEPDEEKKSPPLVRSA